MCRQGEELANEMVQQKELYLSTADAYIKKSSEILKTLDDLEASMLRNLRQPNSTTTITTSIATDLLPRGGGSSRAGLLSAGSGDQETEAWGLKRRRTAEAGSSQAPAGMDAMGALESDA
jgi:hypothetical protein